MAEPADAAQSATTADDQSVWTGAEDEAPATASAPFDLKEFIRRNARVIGATALLVIGLVFVMLGWYGAASTNILTEQIPYLISGGLLGLGLIIVSGFLAASSMLEARTDQMRKDLLRAMEVMPSSAAPSNGARRGAAPTVFVLKAGHSYHSAGCPIIEGKENVSELEVREAIGKGLDMCKLCGPE